MSGARPRPPARALGGVLLGALCACSGAPLPSDMERAQALERTGGAAALAAWRAIRAACPRPDARPRDECGLAAMREAQALEQQGRWAEAAEAWEALPARTSDPRQAARALARAATVWHERLDGPDRARAIAWRCVQRYADEVPADSALDLLVRLERSRDAAGLRARLDALAARLAAGTRETLIDRLLYRAAEVSEAELADPTGAVERYDTLVRHYPRSGLADDANWRAAALLRRSGDPDGAIERLRRILRTRRVALITGSYNAMRLDDAQLLLGQILRDDLRQTDRAIDAFRELADDFPDSLLRDDALYELAQTCLVRGAPSPALDPARPGAVSPDAHKCACAALGRLQRQFPDGNRARAARQLAGAIACTTP